MFWYKIKLEGFKISIYFKYIFDLVNFTIFSGGIFFHQFYCIYRISRAPNFFLKNLSYGSTAENATSSLRAKEDLGKVFLTNLNGDDPSS